MRCLSFLVAGFLFALVRGDAFAGTPVFLGKSVAQWRQNLESADATTRRSAAFALGRMGEEARSVVLDLARHLRSEKEATVRDMAASAIGDIVRDTKGGTGPLWRESGGVLNDVLKKDSSERVRRSAAYALGCFGSQASGAAETLLKALHDDSATVRQNAAWALGQIGPQVGGIVAELCDCLKDKEPLVRRDAAGAIGAMGKEGKQGGRPLLELVKSETDPVVKKTALDALGHIAGPEHAASASGLEPLLDEKDPEIRLGAAIVLARIGGEHAARGLPVLQAALRDPDPHVLEVVTASLSNIGPAAKPALSDLADVLSNEKNPVAVRRNAALAIGHMGAEAEPVVPTIVKALTPNTPLEVRQFAAEALAQMKYPANEKAISAILDAIENDTDPIVRQKCVWSLFAIDSPDKFRDFGADKALLKLLDEKGDGAIALVRYDAARKLANVLRNEAPDKTTDVLLEMLNNRTLKVYNRTDAEVQGAGNESARGKANVQANLGGDARYMAVQALSWLGSKARKRRDVMDALRKAAKDDDPALREAGKKAMTILNEE